MYASGASEQKLEKKPVTHLAEQKEKRVRKTRERNWIGNERIKFGEGKKIGTEKELECEKKKYGLNTESLEGSR